MEAVDSHTCCLQAGDPGKPVVSFQSKSDILRNRRTHGVRPSLRAGQTCQLNSQAEKANSPFLHLSFQSGPQQIGWCPPAWVRTICFIQFTNSNANLFQKHSHRCPGMMCIQISEHPMTQSNWYTKLINHHTKHIFIFEMVLLRKHTKTYKVLRIKSIYTIIYSMFLLLLSEVHISQAESDIEMV